MQRDLYEEAKVGRRGRWGSRSCQRGDLGCAGEGGMQGRRRWGVGVQVLGVGT